MLHMQSSLHARGKRLLGMPAAPLAKCWHILQELSTPVFAGEAGRFYNVIQDEHHQVTTLPLASYAWRAAALF